MVNQHDFATWSQLEAHVQELVQTNAAASGSGSGYYSHLLFRGQANSSWSIETTLERARPQFTELADYYRAVAIAKTQVETFTNRRWEDIDYPKLLKLLENYNDFRFASLPSYEFLVYLRHHGFPSPLLDWTRSLYVAAFFAFQEPKTERVAFFVYQEHAGSGKSGSSASSQILVLGPNIRSHPRHFLQQGEYTLCCRYSEGIWRFASHSSVFDKSEETQDRLWKFTVPSTEASAVLDRLDEYNINAFSLFQSEESLMASLARRVIPS